MFKFLFFSNLTIFLPLIILFALIVLSLFVSEKNISFYKNLSFCIYFFMFIFYSMIFIFYSKNLSADFFLFFETSYKLSFFNLNMIFGMDTLSMLFLMLTSLMGFLSMFMNWNFFFIKFKIFMIVLSMLQMFLMLSFMSLNFLPFYFFFESTLMPMFFMISYWGSSSSKIHASYLFIFYAVLGSIFLLLGLFMLYSALLFFVLNVVQTKNYLM